MSTQFIGLGVAMVTPFDANGAVDVDALKNLTEYLISGGIDYLVVQGTTGESVTLTKAEKALVLRTVVEVNNGRKPVVLGHGGNNTQALIDGFDDIDWNGVDAILSASPSYNKPTQAGIIAHYKALSAATPKPIILYNVPGRTASNMLPETTAILAKEDNIIGIKEAAGDLEQVGAILRDTPENFLVISGDDPLAMPHIAMGGHGVISVIGNALPDLFSSMVHHTLNGELEMAREEHLSTLNLIGMLFKEGNPGGVKSALKHLGVCGDEVRLPLVGVSDELSAQIAKEVDRLRGGV